MTLIVLLFFGAILAGAIQSITGFGAAVVLMMILPHFLDMIVSPALSSSICVGLTAVLFWKFRKKMDWRICLAPTALYMAASITAISLAPRLDLSFLSLFFGLFLIALSLYSLFAEKRASVTAGWKMAVVCSLVSGVFSGLFSIGGPLMALYFISVTDSKESFTANSQFLFSVANVVNLATRIARGIYTAELVPLTLIGFLGVLLGKSLGLRILHKLDVDRTKKLVYAFVGVSGLITTVQHFL